MKNLNLLLYSLAILIPSIYAAGHNSKPDCSSHPNGAILTDTRSCQQYYQCYMGRAFRKRCLGGFYYDDKLKMCNFPKFVECFGQGVRLIEDKKAAATTTPCNPTTEPTTTTPCKTSTTSSKTTTCPPKTTRSTTTPCKTLTEPPTEPPTQPPTESTTTSTSCQPPTEPSTEPPTESTTTTTSFQPPTESSTELPTESTTNSTTSQPPTEPPTESTTTTTPCQPPTEPLTEPTTSTTTCETSTEPPTEPSSPSTPCSSSTTQLPTKTPCKTSTKPPTTTTPCNTTTEPLPITTPCQQPSKIGKQQKKLVQKLKGKFYNTPAPFDAQKHNLLNAKRIQKLCSNKGLGNYVREPSDCSTYYMCNYDQAVVIKCPKGLYYDDGKGYCNYAKYVKCEVEA